VVDVKEENIVFLAISTFVGTSPGAIHYYGRLEHLQGGVVDVTFPLTEEQAKALNVQWGLKYSGMDAGYQKGEQSERFPSEKKLIVVAKKQFKVHFPKATVLVLGSTGVVEPQEILVGPKEFKDAINVLARRYDKLNWDTKADRKEIKELEKRWQELWPRKYTYFE